MPQKIKFGTDGWRGIIGKDFNLNNVASVAQAIADYLTQTSKQAAKVAVGYDTRRLSRQAARCIAQVLAANKIKVTLSQKPLPVQAISYTVRFKKYTAGIMVTASHNPPSFNGIKIKGSFGGPVESKITSRIEKFIFKSKVLKVSVRKAQKRGFLEITNLVPGYLRFLKSYLNMSLLNKGRLRVLVDSMHGTANGYIAWVLRNSSFKVTTIHQNFDSTFGAVKPEPIQSCLREASGLLKGGGFDVGLATDGDADRIGALDSRGRFVDPQQIISLLLLYLVRYRKLKGAVVKTISGTALLERIAKKYKLRVYETPVGFKHISQLMQSKNILIGGEEAGGIGVKNYLPERDGILVGLLLLEMMITKGKSLAQLLKDMHAEFGSCVYLRKDIKCLPCDKIKVRQRIASLRKQKKFLGITIRTIKDYDGLKFYLSDGSWILFRLSGTEPILRIYAESSSLAKTKQLIAQGTRRVKI
ncbi:MAG: phosphoglucomutase/phosphomannomutase family protein [Omnitrophica bacterium]|nr:phosphoglucomutase/phosphomannomutase family protein [Candidatus Omnitrophota bacterium]